MKVLLIIKLRVAYSIPLRIWEEDFSINIYIQLSIEMEYMFHHAIQSTSFIFFILFVFLLVYSIRFSIEWISQLMFNDIHSSMQNLYSFAARRVFDLNMANLTNVASFLYPPLHLYAHAHTRMCKYTHIETKTQTCKQTCVVCAYSDMFVYVGVCVHEYKPIMK